MKQIMFTALFIFAFCFVAFAQKSDNQPIPQGDPVDRFGKLSLNDYKARIDNLAISTLNDSGSEGLLILKFNKKDSRKYKIAQLKNIRNHFAFRKFDETHFSFIISEGEFEESTFWIVPLGAKYPEIENSILIKAEELEQKIKELFPKK